MVYSTVELLNREIEYLPNVFRHTNCYSKSGIQNIVSKVKEEQSVPFFNIRGSH